MSLQTKALVDPLWTPDGAEGSLKAVFSTFNTPDKDGDVVLQSAFTDGQHLELCWAHDLSRPIGDGVVRVHPDRAEFDGRFWLDTDDGLQSYRKVKNRGARQEYSYTYEPLEAEQGLVDGKEVRVLRKLDVWEVSPVFRGAGVNTRTEAIKAIDPEGKPFPAEHSCRLADPSRYDRFRRVNNDRQHDGKSIDVIYGHPRSGGGWEQQALRLPTSDWDAGAARSYCAAHQGTFEMASGKDADVLLEDARALLLLEAKVGRPISAARRERIAAWRDALQALRQELDDLLTETDPAAVEDGKRLFLEFERTRARLNGVAV